MTGGLRELVAGPVRATFDADAGELRDIRWHGVELINRLYVAIRDRDWGTVPNQISDLVVDAGAEEFTVRFRAENRQNDPFVAFAWNGEIRGSRDGTITCELRGRAVRPFERNRIGFCVLHGLGCAGQAMEVVDARGGRRRRTFPVLIEPHQPAIDMTELAHEFLPGRWARLRFEGDLFEMEDQRNWTDASYKTYSTPLSLPRPVRLEEGAEVWQRVTLAVPPAAPWPARPPTAEGATIALGGRMGTLPRLGLGVSEPEVELSPQDVEALRALQPAHLRIDLDLGREGWRHRLAHALRQSELLGVPLEVGLRVEASGLADLRAVNQALAEAQARVARYLVFDRATHVTPAALSQAAREHLRWGAAPIGGGSIGHFTELNRNRPEPAAVDLVAYPANPQVHAVDDRSILETVLAQGVTVASARALFPGLPVEVSPISLRARFNVYAAQPDAPEDPRASVDPRQASAMAAAFTVGSLAAIAAAGASAATYYETAGERGVLAGARDLPAIGARAGDRYPVYHVLAAVAGLSDAPLLQTLVSAPFAASALAVETAEGCRLLVANRGESEAAVRLAGLGDGTARVAPLGGAAEQRTIAEGQLTLRLPKHGVATVDVTR